MAASPTKRKRGRPRKPDSEKRRNNVTLRMRDVVKRHFQESAANAGRSLSEEIEYHLERARLEEETFGGRDLHGLLLLMVGAAKIIQERTGKPLFLDWGTWVAVQESWKRLGVTFGPLPPKGWREALLKASMATTPAFEEPPPEDAEPGVRAAYLIEASKGIQAISAFYRYQEDDRIQEALGEEIATTLLPKKPEKES